ASPGLLRPCLDATLADRRYRFPRDKTRGYPGHVARRRWLLRQPSVRERSRLRNLGQPCASGVYGMWLSPRASAHFSSIKCFCSSVSLTLPFSTCSMFRRPHRFFQAALSCSSTDTATAGAGSSSGGGAASGVIDCVVTGMGFLSATGTAR